MGVHSMLSLNTAPPSAQQVMCTSALYTALVTCWEEPLLPTQSSVVRWALQHHRGCAFPTTLPTGTLCPGHPLQASANSGPT